MHTVRCVLTALVLIILCSYLFADIGDGGIRSGPGATAQMQAGSSKTTGVTNHPLNRSNHFLLPSHADFPALSDEALALAERIKAMKATGSYDQTLWDEYFNLVSPSRQQFVPGVDQGGDDCPTAAAISTLPFSDAGTTAAYNNDYDYSGSSSCPWASTSPDVVYQYSPFVDEQVDISLCNSSYDTKLIIYEDVCDNSYIYACDDDGCGYFHGYASQINDLDLHWGHTYYIVVDGYGGDAGEYMIDINPSLPRPPNDDCADAILIPSDTTNMYVDLTGATLDCYEISDFPEVWYKFILDPSVSDFWNVEVSWCGTDPAISLISAQVQNDCNCHDAIGYTGFSPTICASPAGLPEWIEIHGVPAGVWYLPIYTDLSTFAVIDLRSIPAPTDSCPPVYCWGSMEQPNDGGCMSPPNQSQPIQSGEIICATATASGGIRDTDWYMYASAFPQTFTWDVWNDHPLDMEIGIYDGMCNQLYFADSSSCGETIITSVMPPGIYFFYAAHNNFTGVPTPINYRAKLTCATATTFPCPNQELEPNDQFPPTQMINMGDHFCGIISSPFDQDYVGLNVPNKTAFRVHIIGDGVLHPCVEVRSECDDPIAFAGDTNNVVTDFVSNFELGIGHYELVVRAGLQTTGAYEVWIEPYSLPSGPPPDPIVTIQRAGDDIELQWYDSYYGSEQLRIERADFPDGPWYQLSTIPGNQGNYLDTNPPEMQAFYRVIAVGDRVTDPFLGGIMTLSEWDGQGGDAEVFDFQILELEWAVDENNRIIMSRLLAQGVPPNDLEWIDNDIRFLYGQGLTPIEDMEGHILPVHGTEILLDHISFAQDEEHFIHIVEARGRDARTDSLLCFSEFVVYLPPAIATDQVGIGWWSGWPGFYSWMCQQIQCCYFKMILVCEGPWGAPLPCPGPNPACELRRQPFGAGWITWCICPGQPAPPLPGQRFCFFYPYVKCKYTPCPMFFPPCYCEVSKCPPFATLTRVPTWQVNYWKALCPKYCKYPSWWRWGWNWWYWWWYWYHIEEWEY